MKVILLHGDNTQKLADRLTTFIDAAKKRGWKIERINSSELNFREILTSNTLFAGERLFIIENVKGVSKNDLEWLKKNADKLTGNLVVVGFTTLPKTLISSLPTLAKIELFELPKKIWIFLDSIYPGNFVNCLTLLHEVLKSEPVELVSALLARQLKDIYVVKIAPKIAGGDWRFKKLKFQADKFTRIALKNFIKDLADADYDAKTGQGDLSTAIDLIIATRLE